MNKPMQALNLAFFLDFDGTITVDDVVDRVLEKFADEKWKSIEEEWVSGRIGSRECLERQVACLRATPEQVREELKSVAVDPGFVTFLQTAEKLGVPVTVISDGFDFFIEEILRNTLQNIPHLLKAAPIYSNRLAYENGAWKPSFPHDVMCHHGCANCKPVIMKKLSNRTDTIVLVGDGLSDRYAAKKATLTFAKNRLLDVCRQNQYPHRRFNTFNDVEKWLTETAEKSARAQRGGRWSQMLKGWTWLFRKKNS